MGGFERSLGEFVAQVVKDHDLRAITLQVCDRVEHHYMTQVLDMMVPAEATWTYREQRVFVQDPFTDVELNEAADVAETDALLLSSDPRIACSRSHALQYWGFIDRFHFAVEGVSTRRLRRGVYLVAGYLRDTRRRYAAPLPIDLLADTSSTIHNMVGAEMLRQSMQHNSGVVALRRVLAESGAAAENGDDSLDSLTTRELEIARLVAAGKQTKTVAFELALSEHTVENNLRRIYAKMGVHNRTALAALLN